MNLSRICRLFGVTRQAYYQHFWQGEQIEVSHELIIKEVLSIRKRHKAMGTRKLYEMLQPFLLENQIKIGRDALFDLLTSQGLLIRKRKRKITTTMSYHRFHKWPNLVKEFIPISANELYVSDITYWKIETGYVYISLITDAYSHKIVGYHLADTLEAVESKRALEMALNARTSNAKPLIHHSDRGVQYCSGEYVKLLQDNGVQISMTENSDPRENAIAERINGILKEEYLCVRTAANTLEEAKAILSQSITLYNQERPHMSIGYLTPEVVHNSNIATQKEWKNYYQLKQRKEKVMD